jgi:hypothetical protein
MMTNQSDLPADTVTPVVARILSGENYTLPPKVKAVAVDPAALQAAAGRYRLPGGGSFQVKATGKLWTVAVEGQDALELVWPQVREQAKTYHACNDRTKVAVQAMAAGDFATLRKLRGQEQPEKPFAQTWQGMVSRNGPFQSLEVLGTAPAWFGDGEPTTWMRLRCQNGTVIARLHWSQDGKLLGAGGGMHLAPLTFEAMPQSPTEATGTHLQISLPDLRLKFEKGAKDDEMQLQISTPQGKATAVRER